MNNRLSIVIAFLNEPEEVRNTVSDIWHCIREKADIVVVNVCSDDGSPFIVWHIYRMKFPYRISTELYAYNKFAIASMLLSDRLVGYIKDKYRYAYNIYEAHKEKLEELKSYYQSIFNNDFEYVLRMNNRVELANEANVRSNIFY